MTSAPDRPFEEWTMEMLIDYEQRLYDEEVSGEDTWFERDQVLWELSRRGYGEDVGQLQSTDA